MKKTLQLALITSFIAGCAANSTKEQASSMALSFSENQALKIDKIIVDGKTYSPKNAEESPNISFEKNKFYGYSGCNRFFGSYQSDGKNLQIEGDRVASTQMFCHPLDVMEFENSFLSNFKGSFKIINNNGKLIFKNDTMEIIFQ